MIAFVVSNRAAFITGVAIPVDGGFSVHGPSYADEVAMWASASRGESAARAERFGRVLTARGRATVDADDAALLSDLFSNDVVWHGAAGAGSEGVSGKEQVVAGWNAAARDGLSMQMGEGDVVYADDTHVVGVLELANGSARIRQAHVCHLNAEGKIAAVWTIPDDAAAATALAAGKQAPEHPNLVTFRDAEQARARNIFGPDDMAKIERFLSDDVHWNNPWGQGPSNREEVVAQFGTFNEATGGTLKMDLNEVFANDTHAVSFVRLQADRPERPGKHMDVREAIVFHLNSEGRTFEFWGVAEDQGAINEFWS